MNCMALPLPRAAPSCGNRSLLPGPSRPSGTLLRAYDRIVKVARTIADLEGTADIGAAHLAEAINYRSLDRGSWGR